MRPGAAGRPAAAGGTQAVLPRRRRAWLPVLLLCVMATLAGCAAPTITWHPAAGGEGTPTGPASASPSPSPSLAPHKPQPRDGNVMLGAYVSVAGQTLAQSLAQRRAELGRDYRIEHVFYAWRDDFPTSVPWLPQGSVLMISWRGTYYSEINNGSQDGFIAAQAERLKRYGKPVFLRWAWEMNGTWYVWGGPNNGDNPDGFIAAWRRIHDIFAAHGVTNVAWVWGPNYGSVPDDPWNSMQAYYPGDSYVDWVAVSGYSNALVTPEKMFGSFYRKFARDKPMMIAETGVKERGGTVKAEWIGKLRKWIIDHPNLLAVVWFDTNDAVGVDVDWRVDTSPSALAAFRAMALDPHFQG